MLPTELFRKVVQVLDALEMHYFVTGSAASSIWGEPRFTNDIDIVVIFPFSKIKLFCAAFPASEFYVSEEMIIDAVRHCSQFNIIHPISGFKADIIIADRSPINQSRFARARLAHSDIAGGNVKVSSPEDVIIKKLDFYSQGGSEKHVRDITGILKRQGDQVDRRYIDHWVSELGLTDTWRMILERVQST